MFPRPHPHAHPSHTGRTAPPTTFAEKPAIRKRPRLLGMVASRGSAGSSEEKSASAGTSEATFSEISPTSSHGSRSSADVPTVANSPSERKRQRVDTAESSDRNRDSITQSVTEAQDCTSIFIAVLRKHLSTEPCMSSIAEKWVTLPPTLAVVAGNTAVLEVNMRNLCGTVFHSWLCNWDILITPDFLNICCAKRDGLLSVRAGTPMISLSGFSADERRVVSTFREWAGPLIWSRDSTLGSSGSRTGLLSDVRVRVLGSLDRGPILWTFVRRVLLRFVALPEDSFWRAHSILLDELDAAIAQAASMFGDQPSQVCEHLVGDCRRLCTTLRCWPLWVDRCLGREPVSTSQTRRRLLSTFLDSRSMNGAIETRNIWSMACMPIRLPRYTAEGLAHTSESTINSDEWEDDEDDQGLEVLESESFDGVVNGDDATASHTRPQQAGPRYTATASVAAYISHVNEEFDHGNTHRKLSVPGVIPLALARYAAGALSNASSLSCEDVLSNVGYAMDGSWCIPRNNGAATSNQREAFPLHPTVDILQSPVRSPLDGLYSNHAVEVREDSVYSLDEACNVVGKALRSMEIARANAGDGRVGGGGFAAALDQYAHLSDQLRGGAGVDRNLADQVMMTPMDRCIAGSESRVRVACATPVHPRSSSAMGPIGLVSYGGHIKCFDAQAMARAYLFTASAAPGIYSSASAACVDTGVLNDGTCGSGEEEPLTQSTLWATQCTQKTERELATLFPYQITSAFMWAGLRRPSVLLSITFPFLHAPLYTLYSERVVRCVVEMDRLGVRWVGSSPLLQFNHALRLLCVAYFGSVVYVLDRIPMIGGLLLPSHCTRCIGEILCQWRSQSSPSFTPNGRGLPTSARSRDGGNLGPTQSVDEALRERISVYLSTVASLPTSHSQIALAVEALFCLARECNALDLMARGNVPTETIGTRLGDAASVRALPGVSKIVKELWGAFGVVGVVFLAFQLRPQVVKRELRRCHKRSEATKARNHPDVAPVSLPPQVDSAVSPVDQQSVFSARAAMSTEGRSTLRRLQLADAICEDNQSLATGAWDDLACNVVFVANQEVGKGACACFGIDGTLAENVVHAISLAWRKLPVPTVALLSSSVAEVCWKTAADSTVAIQSLAIQMDAVSPQGLTVVGGIRCPVFPHVATQLAAGLGFLKVTKVDHGDCNIASDDFNAMLVRSIAWMRTALGECPGSVIRWATTGSLSTVGTTASAILHELLETCSALGGWRELWANFGKSSTIRLHLRALERTACATGVKKDGQETYDTAPAYRVHQRALDSAMGGQGSVIHLLLCILQGKSVLHLLPPRAGQVSGARSLPKVAFNKRPRVQTSQNMSPPVPVRNVFAEGGDSCGPVFAVDPAASRETMRTLLDIVRTLNLYKQTPWANSIQECVHDMSRLQPPLGLEDHLDPNAPGCRFTAHHSALPAIAELLWAVEEDLLWAGQYSIAAVESCPQAGYEMEAWLPIAVSPISEAGNTRIVRGVELYHPFTSPSPDLLNTVTFDLTGFSLRATATRLSKSVSTPLPKSSHEQATCTDSTNHETPARVAYAGSEASTMSTTGDSGYTSRACTPNGDNASSVSGEDGDFDYCSYSDFEDEDYTSIGVSGNNDDHAAEDDSVTPQTTNDDDDDDDGSGSDTDTDTDSVCSQTASHSHTALRPLKLRLFRRMFS